MFAKFIYMSNGRGKVRIKKLKNSTKVFDYYSQTIGNVYESLQDYNPKKKKNVNIVWWYESRYGS